MPDRPDVPIWIHAPVGRDASLIRSALAQTTDPVRIARDARMLRAASAEENQLGVLVLTQEGFTEGVFDVIRRHVAAQPRWAELPIVLLVEAAGNSVEALAKLQDALPRTKLLVLQRPLRPSEIESAVETMRLSRLRQFSLRDYIERQTVLQRELNHRVKNILATVQAMYGLTVRVATDLDDFDALFQGRLRAMADVHDLLHTGSYTGALLSDAIASVLKPYADGERLEIRDETGLTVHAEAAQSIALMMHELATNAAKYGALKGAEGRVTILAAEEDGQLNILWSEDTAEPISPPDRNGYGTSFVQATMRSLGGNVVFDYASGGLQTRLRLPVDNVRPRGKDAP